jgi:serine/threonine protein kinase
MLTQRDNFIDDLPNQLILVPVLKPSNLLTPTGKSLEDPYLMSSYDVLQLIGKGGFSKVYLVRMICNGKIYAMKIINKKYASK